MKRDDSAVSSLVDMPEEQQQPTEEEIEAKYWEKTQSKLKELVKTERSYVQRSLREVVEGYHATMEEAKRSEGKIKIPQDLTGGKDRIIFGNIIDIYEFHQK